MITISNYTWATCPNCGTANKIHMAEVPSTNKMVLICEPEIGGCDHYFAVEINVKYTVKTYKMVPDDND